MPLTKEGMKVRKNMKKEYGKNKGEDIFYAWLNKIGGKKAAKFHHKKKK